MTRKTMFGKMSFSANLLIKLMASPISQNMLKERSILGVQIAKK